MKAVDITMRRQLMDQRDISEMESVDPVSRYGGEWWGRVETSLRTPRFLLGWLPCGNKRREEVQTRVNTQARRHAGGNIWSTIRNRDLEPRRKPGKTHRFRSWLCRGDALVHWSRLAHLSRIAGREKSPRMEPQTTPAFEEQVAEPVKKKNNHRREKNRI